MERSINQQLREQSLCNHTRNPSSNKIQYHCYKCKLWQEDHLIQEVKFVPEGYISNRKSKKDQEFQRRINLNLKQFLSKFTAKQHPELQADMREKIMKIKKAGPYAKGSRQCAAIVVYFAFQDQIRMTLREYCKQNNLNVKLFNKKLIAYNKLFRRDLPMKQVQSSSQHNYSNIKVQERPEQYVNLHDQQKYEKEPFIQLYPQYPQNINEKNIYKNLQNLHKAVQSIYDDVFKGFYFRNKKQVIVKKVADRINNVDSDRLKAHNFEEDQPINYFYLIFAILKYLSFKICFSRYSQIVNNKAGYTLSKARATEALKMYEEIQSQRIDESEKNIEIELLILERSEKDKEWERPMQQFQLVESGPMVLQEEYFSFQNCYYFLKSGSSDEIR